MLIFYDVDTQNDFMNAEGALYVPDAELIKPNLEKLTDYARQNIIPIVGSLDRHFGTEEYKERETELKRNGGPFPNHCIKGTAGERKIEETSLYSYALGRRYPDFNVHLRVPHRLDNTVNRGELGQRLGSITGYSKWDKKSEKTALFFEKQSYDVFSNPSLEVFLKMADVKEAVVYGVYTDYCVKAAVLGMRKRGIDTYLVTDAIKAVNPDDGKKALDEMRKERAVFVSTNDILENKIKFKNK